MTNLLNSHEATILTELMEGIIEGGYEWGTREIENMIIFVEIAPKGFKFSFVAGLDHFCTYSYKSAILALQSALSTIPC